MRQPALIGALLVVGASTPAIATRLASDDLKAAVSGKTVTIDTPLGLPITVNYGANGLMTGTAGTALAVYLGAGKDRGRWQVRNGKLCQKWFKWLSAETTCLTLRQNGSTIYWRSDEGQTGTARVESGPPAFDGVTASGLGLPPPPAKDADKAKASRRETARGHDEPAKPHTSKSRQEAVAAHTAPHSANEPRLIQAIAPAARPKYTLASLAPLPLPLAKPEHATPPVAVAPEVDPFDGVPVPMRRAAERSTAAMLTHRWCHSNAFGKGPSLPRPTIRFVAPELLSVPTLLTVAQEQAYEGELPLHQASCLTEDPAINILAKLPIVDDDR